MAETVVLVTGASSGFGRECAMYLKSRGYRVFGASRRCPEPSLPFETLHLDVRDDASVKRAIASVVERAGRIDVLVNIAGICLSGAAENHTIAEAHAILDTNTLGVFRMCCAALPHMRKQGSGRIVNVTSLAGLIAIPFSALYCASKFATEGLTESLRMEVRRFGIWVSLLEPGDFLTPMTETYAWTEASRTDTVYRTDSERAIQIMAADCRICPNLRLVSLRLEAILRSRRPALRYTVGMFTQRLATLIHRILPNSWFESLVRHVYQLGE